MPTYSYLTTDFSWFANIRSIIFITKIKLRHWALDKVLEVNGQILKPSKCIPNQVAGTIGKGNRRDLNIGNAGNVSPFYMTDYSLHYFTLGLRNLR